MQKIAVGRTIAHAYGFLFGRVFSIIGLAWLPALIYAGGVYYGLPYLDAVLPSAHSGTAALSQTAAIYLGVVVAILLLHAVIAIALTQQALGVRKDMALAHFVIGPREVRLFLAYVRLYLIFIVGYVALALLSILGTMQAAQFAAAGGKTALTVSGISILPAGFAILALVLLVAFLLSILRLAFLIAPIAAVEHQASLRQSWRLTKGSAWRIVAVILCVFVPVFLLAAAGLWFWSGDALLGTLRDMMATRPPDAAILARFEASHALVFAVAGGVVFVVMAALQAGATAAAYRTVTGHEENESEDDAALVAPLTAPTLAHHDDGHVAESDQGSEEQHHDDGEGQGEPHDVHDVHAEPDEHAHHAQAIAGEQADGGREHSQGDESPDDHVVQDGADGEAHMAERHDVEGHAGEDRHNTHAPDEQEGHHAEATTGALDPAGLNDETHDDDEQAVAA